jgi:hypothetical protein
MLMMGLELVACKLAKLAVNCRSYWVDKLDYLFRVLQPEEVIGLNSWLLVANLKCRALGLNSWNVTLRSNGLRGLPSHYIYEN